MKKRTELQWFKESSSKLENLNSLRKGTEYNLHIKTYTQETKNCAGYASCSAEFAGTSNKKKTYKFEIEGSIYALSYSDLFKDTDSTELINSKLYPWYLTEK